MKRSIYVNGEWIIPESGKEIEVINPATNDPIATIGYGGAAEAMAAVTAADQAFPAWSKKSVYERAGFLQKLSTAMRRNSQSLAHRLTLEVGKPLPESLGEINGAADQFEWYAEEVKRSAGDMIPGRMENQRHMTIRHAVGPVAAISPWNFPVLLSSRKIAPALAAGCTVISRPASQAPLTMMDIFGLMDEIGFPKGVANLIIGSADACSDAFVQDPRIKKISFTGSLEIGRKLYMACAAQMKKVSLELGGHSPFIVMPDVSPREAARIAGFSKYRNMGQVCISPSRFFVPNSMKSEFEEQVVAEVAKLKIGNGVDPFVDVGPLFEEKRVKECLGFIADIKEKGGKILYGGGRPKGRAFEKGFFFTPTVATDISPDMRIMQEEPFSPIMPIVGYDTVDEVIEMANNTLYGLAAYVLTDSLKWSVQMAESLEAGIIGINNCAPASAHCPFGGMKASGIGREGWRQGLDAYYETKYISIGI